VAIFLLDNITTNQKLAFRLILGRAHNLGGTCGAEAIPSFWEANSATKKNCCGLKRLPIDVSNAKTNQKHAGKTEERKGRIVDQGGAWGKRDSIILVAIELGGDKN
jgi:hypothetical protein